MWAVGGGVLTLCSEVVGLLYHSMVGLHCTTVWWVLGRGPSYNLPHHLPYYRPTLLLSQYSYLIVSEQSDYPSPAFGRCTVEVNAAHNAMQ